MRAKEFLIEDMTTILWDNFLRDYNEYCIEKGFVLEGTAEGEEIIGFLEPYALELRIGAVYHLVNLAWTYMPNHKFISVANIPHAMQLVEIEESGQLILKDTITNGIRRFPEYTGPVTDKTQRPALFNSSNEKEDFLLMFKLRFSQWKITESAQ